MSFPRPLITTVFENNPKKSHLSHFGKEKIETFFADLSTTAGTKMPNQAKPDQT